MSALLDARGLGLPGRLQPTDLAMERPQLLCLVGPNGSGKTSLLHAVARIGRPEGTVRIEGADPESLAPDLRKRTLAYLPASRDIAWPLMGRDLIRLGLSGLDENGLDRAVEALDLSTLAERRIDQLSTGERSRVLIARALAARPKLLLLDEPASNLDPKWQLRLMEHLRAISREQGVIAALHDLDLAARYADRLIVMSEGRVAADGAPAEIISSGHIPTIFGIERDAGTWRLVSPAEDPRSSR